MGAQQHVQIDPPCQGAYTRCPITEYVRMHPHAIDTRALDIHPLAHAPLCMPTHHAPRTVQYASGVGTYTRACTYTCTQGHTYACRCTHVHAPHACTYPCTVGTTCISAYVYAHTRTTYLYACTYYYTYYYTCVCTRTTTHACTTHTHVLRMYYYMRTYYNVYTHRAQHRTCNAVMSGCPHSSCLLSFASCLLP